MSRPWPERPTRGPGQSPAAPDEAPPIRRTRPIPGRRPTTILPFGLALLRAAPTGQWRDDLPAVRDLGLVAVGVGGGVSTLVTQALSLVPLGSRSFRAAFGAALALALAARLLYGICRRTLL